MDTLEEAAARVRRGDTAAFQSIVTSTSDSLVRLSARILGNVSDAEDVVQESMVKAYRALVAEQFDGRSSVKTWLYRIVTHGSIDALRKRRRERTTSDEGIEAGWDGLALAEARLALQELTDWLAALPEEQRVAIVLKSVEGLSTPEIAEILECSEGAVEQRLVRARATLRQKRSGS
ncbi:MAG: sigma-70 family RNA polymerase sigma factor [Polyangiaceae bacterium]|nr:sigma-70 family RNA polymerase sigma factor [Polyangiaceae bacterium]